MEGDSVDVGFFEDALFGIQHAISAEHHSKESYSSTKRQIFFDVNKVLRPIRSKYLVRIVKEGNAQGYCITKHLSAFAQSLKEMADRYVESDDLGLCKDVYTIILKLLFTSKAEEG